MDKKVRKKRSKRRFTFRGYDLDKLLEMPKKGQVELFRARIRRRFGRGLTHKFKRLIIKVKKAKADTVPGEKPKAVKTHLRNAIIMPEMVGAIVSVYSGREFCPVDIRFDMIGRYLGEFALSYRPTSHGKPGVGATKGSQHVEKK